MSPSSAKVCPLCGFDDCETFCQSVTKGQPLGQNCVTLNRRLDQSQLIKAAAKLLTKSKSTLICGLDHLDSAAQLAAWRLADQAHAILDSSLLNSSRAATQSMQQHGKVSATYGQIRNHSDLLVFWDCDLQPEHACLLRLFLSKNLSGRKTIFVGSSDSPMARWADLVFAVDTTHSRNPMVRLLNRLRAKVAGYSILDDQYSDLDVPQLQVQKLFEVLKNASYGSLFFSSHETDWEFDLETESLLKFVSEFNSVSPLVCMKVRTDPNGLGAESVITLASGFPAAISLKRGQATSSGSLYSASEVLRRSACDIILLCGNTDGNASQPIPDWLQDRLQRIIVIQLAPRFEAFADLFIACPTLEFGTAFAGNVLRGDGVMLSGVVPDATHSAELILNSLAEAHQKILN